MTNEWLLYAKNSNFTSVDVIRMTWIKSVVKNDIGKMVEWKIPAPLSTTEPLI